MEESLPSGLLCSPGGGSRPHQENTVIIACGYNSLIGLPIHDSNPGWFLLNWQRFQQFGRLKKTKGYSFSAKDVGIHHKRLPQVSERKGYAWQQDLVCLWFFLHDFGKWKKLQGDATLCLVSRKLECISAALVRCMTFSVFNLGGVQSNWKRPFSNMPHSF